MRMRGKVDANQSRIVKELRQAGCSVAMTSNLGGGFPDILVGWRGVNVLAEIKDPNQPPSKRRLTPDEQEFHAAWKGQKCVIETAEDILKNFAVTVA